MGKYGPVAVPSISPQKRNGVVIGYSAYLGKQGDQRRQRRFFANRVDAEKFIGEQDRTPLPIGELWDRRTELLYNLERLRSVKTNLTDVVTFYLTNIVKKGDMKLSALVTEFLEEKQRVGRSVLYDRTMRYWMSRFVTHVGTEKPIGDVTRREIADYVYERNKHVSSVTKRNLLTILSVVFNFAVNRDYLETNPVAKIDRPSVSFQKPHVLAPSDFEKLLRRCYDNGWSDRLTVFVLVGFCGIRVEEASRLKWANINLRRKIVEVPSTVAKKASFRNNPIPSNALRWLELVEDKRRTGPLMGDNWRNLLRSAVRFTHISYRKNCIRHSFCSYALASGWSLADVVSYMGHGGSPTMVFSHYRNVVSPEDGKRWFSIAP